MTTALIQRFGVRWEARHCTTRLKLRVVLALNLLLLFTRASFATPLSDVPPVSRWHAPHGITEQLHSVPVSHGPLDLSIEREIAPPPRHGIYAEAPAGRIAFVVQADLLASASNAVADYEQALVDQGHAVVRIAYRNGSAADLRTVLAGLYAEPAALDGALFVGDIPYVLYEMMQDWDGAGCLPPVYDDFPCDLYFMDLDGHWGDSTSDGMVAPGNGKLDVHSGDRDIEIWVARIKLDPLHELGSEADLLECYVTKRTAFCSQPPSSDARGLVYNDDDWTCLAQMDAARIATLYGPAYADVVSEAETTTASDYRDHKLTGTYEFVSVRSHGYFGGHGFYRDNRAVFEHVYADDYPQVNPQARFYSLFVCSGCDFTRKGYLGGAVSLAPDTRGLLAIGSTKTGGMFDEDVLYDALAEQHSFGSGFRTWFNRMLATRDATECETWFYGMVMIGDASLAPSTHTPEPGSLLGFVLLGIVWRQTRARR